MTTLARLPLDLTIPDAHWIDNVRAGYAILVGLVAGGLVARLAGCWRTGDWLVPFTFLMFALLSAVDEADQIGQPFNVIRLPVRIVMTVAIGYWLVRSKSRQPVRRSSTEGSNA